MGKHNDLGRDGGERPAVVKEVGSMIRIIGEKVISVIPKRVVDNRPVTITEEGLNQFAREQAEAFKKWKHSEPDTLEPNELTPSEKIFERAQMRAEVRLEFLQTIRAKISGRW